VINNRKTKFFLRGAKSNRRQITLSFVFLAALSIWVNLFAVPQESHLNFNQQLDGVADYVEISPTPDLDLSAGEFTLSAWIKPTGWGENNQGRILDHGGGSTGGEGWSFHLENGSTALGALRVQINNNNSFSGVSDTDVVTLDSWQHVAVTLKDGTLSFYVDGNLVGTQAGVPTPLASSFPVRIGARASDNARGFDGSIDEVRIWNRALSQVELQAYRTVELNGDESGLVAYYQFNNGAGQSAIDSTGNLYHGILGSQPDIDVNDPAWGSAAIANQTPFVHAGQDKTAVLSQGTVVLDGIAVDDGLPTNTLIVTWTVDSGPGIVNFTDDSSPSTNASFSEIGNYILRLSADDGELSSSDTVAITIDADPVLSDIVVTPSVASLIAGETQQFSSTGLDQTGSPFPISPNWSATGGTVDNTGLYTAGNITGSYSVTAEEGAISGAASVSIQDGSTIWPTDTWVTATPAEMGMDQTLLEQARDFALTAGGSGMIIRSGRQVMAWGDQTVLYDLKSTTKSIGSTILGLALKDSLLDTQDLAQLYLPELGTPPASNTATGWLDDITIEHLATHSAGFDKPGGYHDILFQPGTAWSYSDGGANWLADVLTVINDNDLRDLLFSRVLTPMGLQSTDLTWRNNNYREDTINGIKRREFGSGIRADVDAMARIGYLYLRNGEWDGQNIIHQSYISLVSQPNSTILGLPVFLNPDDFPSASDHYSYLWWNNGDGTLVNVPTDAYWAWGLFDSLIVVIPSLDIVVVRAGNGWRQGWNADYSVIEPFLEPIAQSVSMPPDTESPTVSLTSPLEGQTVSGTVQLVAAADDNVAVESVTFTIDTTELGTVTTPPYEMSWFTTAFADGNHTVTATATDTSSNQNSSSINVTVDNSTPVNTAPTVVAGADQTIRLPQNTANLSASITDDGLPNGNVTTAWELVSGPAAVSFTDANAATTDVSFTLEGVYVLGITADDGDLSSSDTLTVTVEAAPILASIEVSPASVYLYPNETQQFSASGLDQYGDPHSVNPVWSATGGVIDGNGYYQAGATLGDYQVDVSDSGLNAQSTVTIGNASLPKQTYLQFDGIDDVFTVADAPSLDLTAAVSVEAWVKPVSLSNSKSQDRVVTKDTDYELTVSTGDTGCHFGTNGDVQWRATIGNQNRRICGGSLTLGNWHHLVGTYDGSQFNLYVDGTLAASVSRSGSITVNNVDLTVGNRIALDRPFDGSIEEVRIWNRALTSQEVINNANQELSGSESGLVAYYKFNENTGQIGGDETANINNGWLGMSGLSEASDPLWNSEVPVNQAPAVDAGADQSLTLPTNTANLSATVSDDGLPNGSLITTWSQISGPDTVVFADTSALDTTATFPVEGSYVLELSAYDGALTTTDTLTVTLNPPGNTAPVVDAGSDQTITLPTNVVSLSGIATDDGLPAATLITNWKKISGPGNVTFDDASALNTSATFNQDGIFVLELTADDTDLTTSDTVSITVLSEPQDTEPPNVTIDTPSDGVVVSDSVLISATATDNVAVSAVNFTIDGTDLGTVTVPPYEVTWDTTQYTDASYTVTATATDTSSNQNSASINVSVENVNDAPVVDAGQDRTITEPVNSLILHGTVTDDGLPGTGLIITWSLVSGPGTVTFSTPNSVDTTATLSQPGAYVIRLTADDGELTTFDDRTVILQPAPYPVSSVITAIDWAPQSEIVSDANGSDNWPITWGDDDKLYTAYGDGFGFTPPPPQKLSLGLSEVSGPATAFTGLNISAPTAEQLGDGKNGKKASGMLMLEGMLYMWVRNADNDGKECQLAWSDDHAATWTWNTWQFAEFGYCAFLNFGKNYTGARDNYVYMYAADTPSAYLETDNMVLTRVPKDQITDRTAYEFFQGLDGEGNPLWTVNIADRLPVFSLTGGVNRLDVTFNAGLGRYLLTLRSRALNGGVNHFSIFEAREPWGPWATVYYTEDYDGAEMSEQSGWGESQHIPSKWISANGREFYLVFSGGDTFSVRKATLSTVADVTPPTVSLTSPLDGAQIAGTTLIAADATDDFAVSTVSFSVDGSDIGTVTIPPYEINWDSTTVADGDYVITAIATDSSGNQTSDNLTVTVDNIVNNGVPDAVDDLNAATTPEDTAVTTVNVLLNDSLVDNAVISDFDSTTIGGGSVVNNGDGTFTYTPASGYNGSDEFNYTITDDNQESDSAKVTLSVTSVNNGVPDAVDDLNAATTTVDTAVTTINVLLNDILIDHATISTYDANSSQGGVVSSNGDGTFNYTPAQGFNGIDSFTYTLSDDESDTDSATVTLTVNEAPNNDGPGLGNLTYSASELFQPASIIDSPEGHGNVSMVNGYLMVPYSRDGGGQPDNGGIEFWDVSDPRNPVLVVQHDNEDTHGLREPQGFSFSNDYPGDYMAAQAIDGIQFWDLSDPLNISLVNYMDLPGIVQGDYTGDWWLFWQAPYVYVAGTDAGLYVVDATDPGNPTLVNHLLSNQMGGINPAQVFALGNLLVLTEARSNSYATMDISNPTAPQLLNNYTGLKGYSHLFAAGKLFTSGNSAPNQLAVHNISHEGEISFIGVTGSNLGAGGYSTYQDGYIHSGFSSKYAKFDIANLTMVGSGTSGVENNDEDFAHALGNLVFVGDDHGKASGLIVHQAAADTTGPEVHWVHPQDGATNMALTSRVGVSMSDNIDIDSVSSATFTVRPIGGQPLTGKYSLQFGLVNFSPDAPLQPGTTYELIVNGLKDYVGNSGGSFSSTFSTAGASSDFPSCTLNSLAPAEVGTSITFDVATVNGSGPITYSWDFGDDTTPTAPSAVSITSHAYTSPGRYGVILTVENSFGSSTCTNVQIVHNPLTPAQPVSSSPIIYTSQQVFNVNADNNTVTAINADNLTKSWESPVETNPRTLAQAPNGDIWVVNEDSATISILNPLDGSLLNTIDLPYASRPYGIVFNPDGSGAYVTLQATGRLLKLDTTGAELENIDVGPHPRGIAISGDGSRILVTRMISPTNQGEIREINGGSVVRTFSLALDPGPDTEASSRGVANYLNSIRITPDGRRAFIPSKKDNIERGLFVDGQPLTFDSRVRTIVSQLDMETNLELLSSRLDVNDREMAQTVIFSPLGDIYFVATQGNNKVDVFDAYNNDFLGTMNTGLAPQGMTFNDDATKLFVLNFMSRSVSVFDISNWISATSNTGTLVAEVSTVANELLSTNVLQGKQIFYNAADPRMSRQGYISCASCHLDGQHDGQVWDFTQVGEGLRNTITLVGRAGLGHGNVHWTANFDEIQDFENDIRAGFEGTGFLSDADFNQTSDPLGNTKVGLSPELDALADYVSSLIAVPASPYRNPDGSLTADAQAGQQLFLALGCKACHSSSAFTDTQRHDVGTIQASSGLGIGQPLDGVGFETPTLKGIWNTMPYLHNGQASSLYDVLDNATHIGSGSLTQTERDQLVAYLNQIDENPVPEAVNDDNAATTNEDTPVVTVNVLLNDTLVDNAAITAFDAATTAGGTVINNGDGTFTYTPPTGYTGVDSFTYTLTDEHFDADIATVSVNVEAAPDTIPPSVTITAPLDSATVQGTVLISADASDNDTVSVVTFLAGVVELGSVNTPPYEINWDTTAVANGNIVILATAEDGSGNTASDSVTVNVANPINTAPAVEAGADQTIRLPVNTVSLSATVTDDGLPSGNVMTTWSLDSGPAPVSFSDATALDTDVSFSAEGTYVLAITADDGALSNSDTLTVTVEAAPELIALSISPITANLLFNESQQFTASGLDQYGDAFAVDPVWNATGGTIDGTGLYQAGTTAGTFQVTASESGLNAQATVTVASDAVPKQTFLRFDGGNDVFTVPDDPSLDITGAISLEVWIKPQSLSNSKSQDRVVSKTSHYEITVSTGDTGCHFGSSGDVQWRATIGNQNRRICGGTLSPGKWHHLVGTYDGADFNLYVDGVLVASTTRSGAISTNNADLTIGNRANLNRPFDGDLDEVRIWTRALNGQEIVDNAGRELSGTEPGLVAYYRFNENSGQTGSDETANSNDGVLGTTNNVDNSDPLWVTENLTNTAPVVDAGSDQTITLPQNTVSLNGVASDDGLPNSTLITTWSKVSGPGNVTFTDPADLNTIASFSAEGDYVLQLTGDDSALSSTDTVTITVLPEPPDTEAPTVNLVTPLDGTTVSANVLISAVASDNIAVSLVNFAVGSTDLGTVTSPPYEVTWDSTSVGDGNHTLTATATDGANNQSSDSVTVTVNNTTPVNAAPSVDAGIDQTIRLPVNTVSLSATVSDDGLPNGNLTTNWELISGPAPVTFSDASATATDVTFTLDGDYVLSITADDGELATSDTLTVVVEAAPVLTTLSVLPSSVNLLIDETQQFSAEGFDQYGDPYPANPSWTATGGTIDSSGLYQAGTTAGNYQVVASEGAVNDQATVTINSAFTPKQTYLRFDGTNDVVTVPDDSSLDITSVISIEVWVRPYSLSNSKSQDRVVSKTSDYEITLSTGDTGCNFGTSDDVQWRATISGSNRRICGGSLTLGNWHHIVGTYDGSQFSLYVDGELVASTSRSGPIATNNSAVTMGNRGTLDRPFDGDLDEVRIWNRALTAQEIIDNANIELTGSEPGLAAYYRLNETSSQVTADETTNNNDGVLGTQSVVDSSDPQQISEN